MIETAAPVDQENRPSQGKLMKALRCVYRYRQMLYIYCPPLAFMWLPILIPTQAAQCAFVLLVMIFYWITECIPMAVTGLLPAVLFPAFGLLPSKVIAAFYMRDIMMLFVGTMVIAAMLENTGLHRRIAIKTLFIIGQEPARILLGMMLTTWFCSMWINNTATTIMMLPTVEALLEQLRECMSAKELAQTKKMLGLAIAYSASIGGVATITGTGTNLILIGQLESSFHTSGGLNFGTWMMFALPLSLIMIIIAWLWLQVYFLGFGSVKDQFVQTSRWLRSKFTKVSKENNDLPMTETSARLKHASTKESILSAITAEYVKLGPLRTEEYVAAVYFFFLVILWLAREPSPDASGWGALFRSGFLSDTPATLAVALLCFMTPVFRREKAADAAGNEGSGELKFLVGWKEVEKATTWSLLFLVGGGFTVSEACKVSGLNVAIIRNLGFLESLNPLLVLALLVVITAALTEVTSNVAICSILMPMLAELSLQLHINPLMIMLPTTIACSFAFMLPVATPPNAIVYSKGYLTVPEMAKCGIGMNIIAMGVTVLLTISYGDACLGINVFPDWALKTAKTVSVSLANATLPTLTPGWVNSTANITSFK